MSCGKPSSWPSSRSLRKRSPMAAIINRVCLMTEKCQRQSRVPLTINFDVRDCARPASLAISVQAPERCSSTSFQRVTYPIKRRSSTCKPQQQRS